jgi:glycosyltransferase involved in cell wall biosynthesis
MQDLTTLRFSNPTKNQLIFKLKQRVYSWVNVIAARKSKAVITPTEFVKDDVAKFAHLNSRKITVTYEAGDTIDAASEPIEELVGKQFIMYVGRPTPHKNLEGLIAAYALMKESRPDLHLVLAGKTDKNFKRHEAMVEKSAIRDVHFTGFISDGQLRWLFENCAAYVFPSFSEGFGLPPLEAMSCGAPVVASNATCIPEVLGDAAHYFDPYDVHDIVRAVGEVLDKPALRQKLIADGKKQVGKYSWKRMAEQTLAVYNSVLSK